MGFIMVHPALFRTALISGYASDRFPAFAPEWKPLEPAKRLLRRVASAMDSSYRPEKHYMRGGRTPGAKSLARH